MLPIIVRDPHHYVTSAFAASQQAVASFAASAITAAGPTAILSDAKVAAIIKLVYAADRAGVDISEKQFHLLSAEEISAEADTINSSLVE